VYRLYLQQRWAEGCTNARQLWRELQAREYAGTYRQVARWAARQRTETVGTHDDAANLPPLAAPRQLVWLLLRPPTARDSGDAAILARLQQHPAIQHAHQ
jgi:hypothetical protein